MSERRNSGVSTGSGLPCDLMGSRTPHDALFHFTFSRKENAIGELRAVLPPQLVARIDWTTLELSDGHYVDEELSKRQSDFLYSVKVGGVP